MCIHYCPGVQKLAGVDASEEEVNELVASTIPIGRVGSKWDIAIAAVFLCSSAARHITGALHLAPLMPSVQLSPLCTRFLGTDHNRIQNRRCKWGMLVIRQWFLVVVEQSLSTFSCTVVY